MTLSNWGKFTAEWCVSITAIVFVVVWLVRLEGRITAHDQQIVTILHEQQQWQELQASRFAELRMDLAYIRMRLDQVVSK